VPNKKTDFGFWDTVSLIVGIVVGTAIFKSPTLVFQNTSDAAQGLLLWVLGGGLSLCGAFCYAELSTSYPGNGGDYRYLSNAYGKWVGFFFAWAQLTAILSGSIAALSYVFGDYAAELFSLESTASVWLAIAAVILITTLNVIGVAVGKSVQNFLNIIKLIGIFSVAMVGIFFFSDAGTEIGDLANENKNPSWGLALVFVMYAYGGWNDAAFVAAEVRDPHRNLPRALIVSILFITIIYLIINVAYLSILGIDGVRASHAPAADAMNKAVGQWGAQAVSLLVMVSCLGALNGMTLSGSRVYALLGEDHRIFRWLGVWDNKAVAPINALLSQALIACLLILTVGTDMGRAGFDIALAAISLPTIPWEEYFGGFEILVACTAPVFWGFFVLTGLALPVLRFRDPSRQRPFRVPLYPLPVILFCATSTYMLYSSLMYAGWLTILGVVPFGVAVPLYFLKPKTEAV